MALATLTDLSDFLDANLGRRRKDLSSLVLEWRSKQKDTASERQYRRLVVILLYAHWEGFIKDASHAYLKHITAQRLRVGEVCLALRAVAVRGHVLSNGSAKKSSAHARLLAALIAQEAEVFDRYPLACIDTESNLSSKVFREIVDTLGLRFLVAYELLANRLDSNLVHERNGIAHGRLSDPDFGETNNLVDEIWKKMNSFKGQIEDSARKRTYLA